jgi:hypothetical protein
MSPLSVNLPVAQEVEAPDVKDVLGHLDGGSQRVERRAGNLLPVDGNLGSQQGFSKGLRIRRGFAFYMKNKSRLHLFDRHVQLLGEKQQLNVKRPPL